MKKAIIVDCNERFDCDRLCVNGWECEPKPQAFETDDDAINFCIDLTGVSLVVLHLGPPSNRWGNPDSWKFFCSCIVPRLLDGNLALIAFTGGDSITCPEPEEFASIRNIEFGGWVIYLNGINSDKDINLRGFLNAWQGPPATPPFDLLQRSRFPEKSIAAYILSRIRKPSHLNQERIAAIVDAAQAESPDGDCAAKIDSYFGFDDVRILRAMDYGILALSLRSKISHSFLDHEVLAVDEDTAISRWRAGTWREIANRWQTLYSLALELETNMHELSASSLVDRLDIFKNMSAQDRKDLKQELDDLFEPRADSMRVKYIAHLNDFWKTARAFFVVVIDNLSDEAEVRKAWAEVKGKAESLKTLFLDGTIPDGIVLP